MNKLPVGQMESEVREELQIDLKDESNPKSLINVLPDELKKKFLAIPEEVFLMGEADLKVKANIQKNDERLRTSFWFEYTSASNGNRRICQANIYSGICRKEQWYYHIIKNPLKLAYIMTPTNNYKVALEELMNLGVEQMRDILSLPHTIKTKTGQRFIDTRLIGQKVKIWETVQNRVKGTLKQTVDFNTKSVNLNIDTTVETEKSLIDIDAEIKRLEESKKLISHREVKDAEAEEVKGE